MSAFIPDEKIREVLNTADIVDIVSERVVLKKAGKNFLGLCPFHVEKTPSFTVSPDKQIFYCFGCAAGGNAIHFIMRQDGLSFPEAIKLIARRCGIDLPVANMTPQQKKRMTEREQLLSINRSAALFYREQLTSSNSGQKALSYLLQRGMTLQVLDNFQLGFAPAGWDNILRYFNKKKIKAELLEKSGLIIPKKGKGGYYDRFRDRIIFPIFDISEQVVGFGGRVLDDGLPKYLNSPETPLYSKSRSLYGIHRAKQSCRHSQKVYIVEGYFDLISLHMHGIENAVATLGTALTPEHLQILKGLVGTSGKAMLVYDSDQAGIKAARRSISVFNEGFMDAGIMVLPEGHDPDSFLLEQGPDEFLSLSKQTLGIIPFLTESAIQQHGQSVEGKLRIVDELKIPLSQISDSMARSLYIQQVSERLGIDETAILKKIREATRPSNRPNPQMVRNSSVSKRRSENTDDPPENTDLHDFQAVNRLERRILSMMLQYPEMIDEIRIRNLVNQFEDARLKSIGGKLLRKSEALQVKDFDILGDFENDTEKSFIASLIIEEELWDRNGCMRLLNQYEISLKRRKKELMQQIRAAEEQNDLELLQQLLKEKQFQARQDI
ncbi:MAG: DNA primase [Desulfobacteraceae bacterium]|nr:DNA primase [Desulfobacteraceae bacterium]